MLIEDLKEQHSNALGDTINSLKGFVTKVKDSGIIDDAKKLTTKTPSGGSGGYVTNINTPPPPAPKKNSGLSTGAWIGITAGGLAVTGLIIYLVTHKSK